MVISHERKKWSTRNQHDACRCDCILTSITTGCLSKQASENSRPNNEVVLLSKMLRGQWKPSLTVSLFQVCKCLTFQTLPQREEDEPCNLSAAGVSNTVKCYIIQRGHIINHTQKKEKGKKAKQEKKRRSKSGLLGPKNAGITFCLLCKSAAK